MAVLRSSVGRGDWRNCTLWDLASAVGVSDQLRFNSAFRFGKKLSPELLDGPRVRACRAGKWPRAYALILPLALYDWFLNADGKAIRKFGVSDVATTPALGIFRLVCARTTPQSENAWVVSRQKPGDANLGNNTMWRRSRRERLTNSKRDCWNAPQRSGG